LESDLEVERTPSTSKQGKKVIKILVRNREDLGVKEDSATENIRVRRGRKAVSEKEVGGQTRANLGRKSEIGISEVTNSGVSWGGGAASQGSCLRQKGQVYRGSSYVAQLETTICVTLQQKKIAALIIHQE